jgi:hypothetical protein
MGDSQRRRDSCGHCNLPSPPQPACSRCGRDPNADDSGILIDNVNNTGGKQWVNEKLAEIKIEGGKL